MTVPRARIAAGDGRPVEWKSKALRAYQRRTKAADAMIASTYLAGTNTRRVRRALAALFDGAVGKDVVSRTWRKITSDRDAWNGRDLAAEPILRLILVAKPPPKPHHEDVGSLKCFSPRSCEGSALAAIGGRLLGHRKS